MLRLPSAKEAIGEKIPNKKNNNTGKKNRFIYTPCPCSIPFSVMPDPLGASFYHSVFLNTILLWRG
jgi:hypothetical protein